MRGSKNGARALATPKRETSSRPKKAGAKTAKPRARVRGEALVARGRATSPPPPPALRVWLETRARMEPHLAHRVQLEHIERAAHLLLEGDSGREANPIVLEAVASIMERVADHTCALEFGASGVQRVAAAEALESVQALLVKLAEPRRAQFVELVVDYARRLRGPALQEDTAELHAIAKAFVMSATRFDRAFRRLSEAYVLRELLQLRARPAKRGSGALTATMVAGAMSAKVAAFNDRSLKKSVSAFEKAWKARVV